MRRRVENPPNPWHRAHVEWLEPRPEVELEVFETEARSILSANDSPDIPFRYSLNPYQGCFHGCSYCYARPSHHYLELGAGTDFERKILVKTNAAELLRAAFERPSWQGERVALSGNTDCYQPLEASYELTRRCLEVCLAFRNPVSLITKGGVILRDIELIAELAREAGASVFVSIAFRDDAVRRKVEPFAAPIDKRFEIVRRLSEAGVEVGVSLAPLIPGLNDADILPILERAAAAGASSAFLTLLRLPAEVKEVFMGRLAEAFPDRTRKVEHALTQMRGGKLYDPRFGARMQGQGARWDIVQQAFSKQCARLGLRCNERFEEPHGPRRFARPKRQLSLF